MKILLIAPSDTQLPGLQAEINAITELHETTLLGGTVRETDIQEVLRRHDSDWDILWFCAHGGSEGIELSAGFVLPIPAIGQYVTASNCTLVVLNSCSSEDAARQIIVGGQAGIIYTVTNLLDSDALRFGALLAMELTRTDGYEEAFNAAKPKQGEYRYLAAGAAIRAMDLTLSSKVERLNNQQIVSDRQLYELDFNQKQHSATISSMQANMASFVIRFDKGQEETEYEKIQRNWLTAITVLVIINSLLSLINVITWALRMMA